MAVWPISALHLYVLPDVGMMGVVKTITGAVHQAWSLEERKD
jgi:hypothetical protein